MSFQIAVIVTVPVVIIMVVFSYHHYSHDRSSLFRNAESQLLRIGEGLLGPAGILLKKNDLAGIEELALQTAQGADIENVVFFGDRGTVIAANNKQWIGRDFSGLDQEAITAHDQNAVKKALGGSYSVYYDPLDKQYCLVMPFALNSINSGAVLISLNLENITSQLNARVVENVIAALVVSAVLGVSIYFLLYYLLTRRIKSISSAATTFAGGDMQARVNVGGVDEIGYLGTSFNLLAEEITNWRSNLEEMAASRMNELLVLFDIVNTISQSLELGKVLPAVLDRVIDNLGVTKGAIVIVGSDNQSLALLAHRGLSEQSLARITGSGQGCMGDVIVRNKPLRFTAEHEGDGVFVPGLEQDGVLSALAVPISARDVVLGGLAVYGGKKDLFTDNDEALLATIGNQVSVAVLNAQLYEKTLELARIDGLTGVANRRYLMERLQQEIGRATRYHTSLSIIMLDLDKFKTFNDEYGHLKGDELLRAFSGMVRSTVRSSDLAGRYGGEEFCIVLPNTSTKGAVVIAERIRVSMEGLTISVGDDRRAGRSVSIGVAEFSVGEPLELLLARADAALYQAKEGGRNKVVFQ